MERRCVAGLVGYVKGRKLVKTVGSFCGALKKEQHSRNTVGPASFEKAKELFVAKLLNGRDALLDFYTRGN